jgi:RNA polymerase sigma factor (TIGR02999 family)
MNDSVTRLLLEWRSGREEARDQLWPYIYDELRRLAGHHMRDQRPGHTLQATALVHEAFLRLVDAKVVGESRGQFLALAARAMRSVLVDHARGKGRAKRGGGAARVTLEEGLVIGGDGDLERMLELDRALTRLAERHGRKADVVELHYFGGLTQQEIAGVLNVSESTIRSDLRFARAWLQAELERGGSRE